MRGTPASVAVLVAVLVLSACGDSPSSDEGSERETSAELTAAADAVEGLDPKQREGKLLELARKEGGELSLYTTLNPKVLGQIEKGFEKKYGIDLKAFETEAASLLQRITQESRADRRSVDVVDTGGPELNQLARDGALAGFESPHQARLGPDAVQDGWTTDRYTQFVVAWNTKRVKAGEQPQSWEELAEPKWKGRLSITADTTGVSLYKGLGDHWMKTKGMTQAEVDRLFEAIARNARVTGQLNVNLELLGAGEFDVAAGSVASSGVEGARRAGAPVAWKPVVEPIVRQRQGIGIVRDARRPATAMLFADYMITDGQEIFAADFRDPARVDLSSAPGSKTVFVDLDALAEQQAELARRWDRIVGLSRKG